MGGKWGLRLGSHVPVAVRLVGQGTPLALVAPSTQNRPEPAIAVQGPLQLLFARPSALPYRPAGQGVHSTA